MSNLVEVCKGRWQAILPLLGVDTRYLTGKHGPCPICGGNDRWRFDDKRGEGTWICSHCGAGNGFMLVMKLKGTDWRGAQDQVAPLVEAAKVQVSRQERGEMALQEARDRLWRTAEMIADDDLVHHYLERRGIVLRVAPADLRSVERCLYQSNPKPEWHPAMLARVCDAEGRPVQLHRTYLDSVGNKAKVAEPRKLMPGTLPKGSAVRLGVPGKILGIAEGIETALAAAQIFAVPVWAAVNARMLLAWEPPKDVSEIVVFGDNDESFTGQSSAFALAHRLKMRHAGQSIRVEIPTKPGTDWNDELLAV